MIDNDKLYWNACYPQCPTVCGIQVKPFSYGHLQQLQAINSPLVGDEWPNIGDFFLALWICSNESSVTQPTFNRRLPLRWRLSTRFIALQFLDKPERILKQINAFMEYIWGEVLFKVPVSRKERGLCRESTCPHVLPVKRVLMSHYGYLEYEFLNMPLRKAKFEYYAWLESEGAIEFRTRKEDEFIARMLSPESVTRSQNFWKDRQKIKLN